MKTDELASSTAPPITVAGSLLVFAIPGVSIALLTYLWVPGAVDRELPLIWAWSASIMVPLFLTAMGCLIAVNRGESVPRGELPRRFRLHRISKSGWKRMPVALLVILVLSFGLEWTQPLLLDFIPTQPLVPEIFADPYEAVRTGKSATPTFFGVPMSGNWWLIPFWLLWVFITVSLEETIWRAYLLPRMEAKLGRWAFLVNGLFWNIPFHLYTPWNVLTDLPMFLIIPYMAQRTGSTWTAVVMHVSLAFLAFAYVIPGILSWKM